MTFGLTATKKVQKSKAKMSRQAASHRMQVRDAKKLLKRMKEEDETGVCPFCEATLLSH